MTLSSKLLDIKKKIKIKKVEKGGKREKKVLKHPQKRKKKQVDELFNLPSFGGACEVPFFGLGGPISYLTLKRQGLRISLNPCSFAS